MTEIVHNAGSDLLQGQEDAVLSQVVAEVSLGEILKRKRENLKIELAEVSSYLRIKNSDIKAIENNQIEHLAKNIYIPGLIRSYGKFLKIDSKITEEKIRLLTLQSSAENKKHILLKIGENADLTPNKDRLLHFALIAALLFLILFSLYNSCQDKSGLITNRDLILELEKINS